MSRVVSYRLELDAQKHPVLVAEKESEYIEKVDTPKKVVGLCNQLFHLEKLAEEFRYSDPVSAPALTDLETDMAATMEELSAAVTDGDNAAVLALCKKISATLAERNRLCKLNKKEK